MEGVKIQDYVVIDDDPLNNLICKTIIKTVVRNAEVHLFADPDEGIRFIKATHSVKEYQSTKKPETLTEYL